MRSGICPKCKTPTVYRKRGGLGFGGGDGVYVRTAWATRASEAEHYICTRCGFFEIYVVDEQKMAEVTSAWEKIIK